MSMKRSKGYSSNRTNLFEEEAARTLARKKEPEVEKSWEECVTGKPDEAFVPYALTTHFDKGALLHHAKFGKGVVVTAQGCHIEVLFADGKRKLTHRP